MLYLSLLLASGFAFQTAPSQNAANTAPVPPAVTRPALSLEDRGDIQMAHKMYRDAIDTYKQAPESAVIMNKIGIAYHQLGDLKSAEKYYKRAVKLDRMYTAALNNLGTIYYSKKSYRRAIGQYKKVLRIKPNSASTLANLGSAYFARKQYELASDAYQQALTLDPHVFDSQSGAGSVVRDRTVGDRPKFFYYLAKSYAKAGMKDEAISYIRKALEEGFKERNRFLEEPEFAGLKNDPEFQKLMTTEPKVL